MPSASTSQWRHQSVAWGCSEQVLSHGPKQRATRASEIRAVPLPHARVMKPTRIAIFTVLLREQ